MLKQVLEAFTPNLILLISLVCTYTRTNVIHFPAVKYDSFSSGSFSLLLCFFWWTGFHSGNCFSVAGDPRYAATFVSISALLLKYNLLAQLDHFCTAPSFHGANCSRSPFRVFILQFLFLITQAYFNFLRLFWQLPITFLMHTRGLSFSLYNT